jgi:hypothetical protein
MTNVQHFPKMLDHPVADQALPPAYSDEALALRFANLHKDDLRYVAAWNCWLKWNSMCWLKDTTLGPATFSELYVVLLPRNAVACRSG